MNQGTRLYLRNYLRYETPTTFYTNINYWNYFMISLKLEKKQTVINIISSSCLLGFLEAFHTTQLYRISLIDRIDLEWILNYFCAIVLCTIFGYKNKNSPYSPKFSCKTFSMNIRSRLYSRFWKIDYTKISQKSFIFLFQKLLS